MDIPTRDLLDMPVAVLQTAGYLQVSSVTGCAIHIFRFPFNLHGRRPKWKLQKESEFTWFVYRT